MVFGTPQGTNISHLAKRKIIDSKVPETVGDMLVPRVFGIPGVDFNHQLCVPTPIPKEVRQKLIGAKSSDIEAWQAAWHMMHMMHTWHIQGIVLGDEKTQKYPQFRGYKINIGISQ